MITAHYQILRYQPYALSGEWVAVGVLLYSPEIQRLSFLKANRLDRASALFPWADVDALRNIFLPIIKRESQLKLLGASAHGEIQFDSMPLRLESLSSQLIPENDNALQWGTEQRIRGESFDWIAEYLEEAIFDKHKKADSKSLTDEEAWRKRFKPAVKEEIALFDQDRIIEVRQREFHFNYAKQNGSLHLIDPASFALAKTDSINKKLDRRYGKYIQIAQANPAVQYTIHVPSILPDAKKRAALIVDTLEDQLSMSNMQVRVYGPEKVGEFKDRLKRVLGG